MTPERWRQVTEVFHAALSHDASVRVGYLDRVCAGDLPLRDEVDGMLAAHAEGTQFPRIPIDASLTPTPRLASGAVIGPYRVADLIGVGGMGEVYRARDTKLGRDVAIKVLPAAFTSDADRLVRFEREARMLAALNHPHIGAIYGFEEAGGVRALVLELVEGPTLADRITRGAIPLDEALRIAGQIAEALEAAHAHGIIHRDLKPANIKITRNTNVKVLDFGLAKAFAGDDSGPDLSRTPTVTESELRPGTIVGTPPYMSPEQVRGQALDKRADIWAFGCVLYEMLTGRRAFHGDDMTDTLATVLKSDPDWSGLPADTPPAIRKLIRRCLEKDPSRRVPEIAVARFEIEEADRAPAREAVGSALPPKVATLARSLAMLLIGAVITGVGIRFLRPASPDPEPVSRFTITLPVDQQFSALGRHLVALSPQGTHLVYVANARLYLRAIDQLGATPIQGTEAGDFARSPFFSADGQWIAFWQGGELRKVAITGGAAVKLWEAQNPWGASWGPDDTILYGQGRAGIWRVSGQGGPPQRVVSVDEKKGEAAHGPQLLPGGRTVLFTLATGDAWNEAQIVVQSLDSGERKVLLRGGRDARYIETGHLVYAHSGTLLAVPFNLGQLAVTGGPVPLVEGVRDAGGLTGATHFSVSGDGSLAYAPGGSVEAAQRRLVWVSRQGTEQPLAAPARAYNTPRLSPDGRRVVVEVGETADNSAVTEVWVYDLARDTLTRLTFEGSNNHAPVWTPDGKRIAFFSDREGLPPKVFWQLADGGGGIERLTSSGEGGNPNLQSWSADGQLLVFQETHPTRIRDIWVFRLGDRKVEPFLRTPFAEGGARFSPDGRWLVYVSNESGRPEVYVQPYPGPGGKWQISIEGGTEPVWNRNGRELFYRSGNKMMVVETTTQRSFSAGQPRILFDGPYFANEFPSMSAVYDVSPDGQRFLMVKETEAASQSAAQINVVLNWTEELRRLVPTN